MVRTMEEEGHLTIQSTVDQQNRTARLSLHGELDLNGTNAVSRKLDEFAEGDVDTVLLDASGLTFLDSSGLRTLLTGRDQFAAKGGQFKVVDASVAVARVLEMTGTREMLEGTE
jgi:anti-anti-sigma factor